MPRRSNTLRNHLHFIVIVGILTAAMTWPTVRHVFDSRVINPSSATGSHAKNIKPPAVITRQICNQRLSLGAQSK